MRTRPSLVWASRLTWFALVGALIAGRDMCAGGGRRPDPTPPADAAPDGAMSSREGRPTGDRLALRDDAAASERATQR